MTAPDNSKVTSGKVRVFHDGFSATELPAQRRTYVAVAQPPGGIYTIQPRPGSVPVTTVKLARDLPGPKVSARVRPRGRKRILRYRIRKIEGQRVTFAEQSNEGLYREFASPKKAKGEVDVPAQGISAAKAPDRRSGGAERPFTARLDVARFTGTYSLVSTTTIKALPPALGLAVRVPRNEARTRQRPIAGGRQDLPVRPLACKRSRYSL